ncbi:MAG: 30S ribosomal protein S9 [Candidatus Diapherotrites archaeon]|nr:30S ribosomal protein S9 [Candidatus Diapherotrites archaeon]
MNELNDSEITVPSPALKGEKGQIRAASPRKGQRKRKGITAKAKKKMAVARAVVHHGKGIVRINKLNLKAVQPQEIQEFISEPLEIAKDIAKEVNIDVTAKGGGMMGQAVASRTAIAKALLEFKPNEKLRAAFLAYDRMLLVDDPRRVETKKPLGTKARKKKQKSKR